MFAEMAGMGSDVVIWRHAGWGNFLSLGFDQSSHLKRFVFGIIRPMRPHMY